MPAFEFKAMDRQGRVQKGALQAHSERLARQLLRDRGLAPISVQAGSAAKSSAPGQEGRAPPGQEGKSPAAADFLFWRRVSTLDLALVTRQIATLVQAGLPLEETLRVTAQQGGNVKISGLLLGIRSSLLEGHTLADALAEFPQVFDRQYRMTVAAGEHAGRLAAVLTNLADYTERRHSFQQDIRSALLYPCILLMLALAVLGALVVYVVPKVATLFAESGQQLPVLTRMLISSSELLGQYGLVLLALGLILAVVMMKVLALPGMKAYWHRAALRLPLIGPLVIDSDAVRFATTLAMLIQSGTPLLEALEIAGGVLKNLVLQARVVAAANRVKQGERLFDALQGTGHFPPLLLQMIASGEAVGKLPEMLVAAADYQEQAFARKAKAWIRLFEPLMLVLMGVLVMFIVLAVLLPILQFNRLLA